MKTNISWKYSHFIVNIIVIVSFVLGMLNLNLVNVVAGPEQPDEFTPLEVVPETEYQVVQNSDKVLMSLALGNGDKVSQYGPVRNDPSQGIPTHAYSPFDDVEKTEVCPPGGCDYVEGRVLIKFKPEQTLVKKKEGIVPQNAVLANSLNQAGIVSLKPLFSNAIKPDANAKIQTADGELIPEPDLTLWFEGTTVSSDGLGSLVEQLQSTEGIAVAEPDFIRKPIGGMSEPEGINSDSILPAPQAIPNIGSDPLYSQQWHLAATHVPEAWAYLESQGLPAGGSRDIVVAVIDTGVDYTHPDLAANIWVNPLEFNGLPDVDDDGNGYVDDIHGVDTVTPDGNPQDDHGHGTHVAGIIAAQAGNGIGGVGVAYNVQIMPIKAAQYSGVLAASDIAEGIYYAVAKGADVINMSFGGYARSQVEEDALAVAFGQAVLVAAAGNDGKINVPCPGGIDMYPAAYNWVLGVMASTESGDLSNFSNRDCKPHDTHEYELKAPGENIWSTLPEGQYSPWSGTSMSAPVVSGIAALARTKWADKDVYSSRFIMGQIASNTSQEIGGVANALTALAIPPRPELSYLEHWLFDTIEINPINDNDGIVDAGETVDLAIEIRNHWGKAENVIVTLEPWAEGAVNPDPYVTMINDTVSFGAIGSFNWDDNGLIYDVEGAIVGVQNPFQFITDPNTPNDHLIPFRLTITADNGYYPGDPDAPYTFVSRFYLLVQRGRELPRVISENMVLTKDYYWLVPDATLIEAGASVLVTEGTQIQFWSVDPNDPYSDEKKPYLQVEGNFETQGSFTEPVEMFNGKGYFQYGLQIVQMDMGHVGFYYTRLNNPLIGWEISGSPVTIDALDHCFFSQDSDGIIDKRGAISGPRIRSLQAANTIFKKLGGSSGQFIPNENMSGHQNLFDTNYLHLDIESINDSVFLKNVNYYTSIAMGVGFRCNLCDPALGMSLNGFRNNAILNTWWDSNINHWMRFYATATGSTDIRNWYNYINNNFWGTTSPTILDAVIVDYNDDFNYPHMVYQPILTTAPETAYPFVVDVHLSTTSNPDVSEVGAEPVTFTVSFNRDMDQTIQPQVSFGPDVPLTDYTVHSIGGGWQNARTWAGTFNINPVTGDGYQLIRVAGAVAADDPWLVTGDDAGRFRFEVITSGTEAMNLQATGGEGYVDLSWTQSDFDLLSGFNLYRSTTQNGTYARINSSIIPPDDRSYRDTDVTPGQPYFYKFTVVKSDMSESDFSNIATATPLDTIAPTLVHTPVTSAEPGLPLTLNASANDNVAVTGVTLYYRRIGASTYLNKSMVKTTGNTYYATIESSILTSPGIQYFIEATDGISITRNGRAENPNLVTVNDRPVVTIVTPNTGSSSGGTAVTITGSNFKTGATVTFGGASASNVVVVNSNQVTCTTPAHFPSSVDVRVTNPDAQYGVLLNGFTFISTAAQVSLPTTGGGNGNVVTVPVNAANLEGLVAASMTITFDPAVLTAKSAATGSLTSGWSFASNLTTPGQVRLSMSSTGGGVGGAGILANIEFEVIGIPGSSSALSITSISLNDGAINVELADGTFSVDDVYNVSGLISFWNGRSPVPGTQLTLTGDHVYTALSGTDGNYTIQGASIDAYALTPSKSDGDEGITAYDASFVLQHDVGLINLNGYAALAADVNSNGIITSMDAFYILQKAVDLISLPFPGSGKVWKFDPVDRSIAMLTGNLTGENFTAVLLGDISGNWTNPSGLGKTLSNDAPQAGTAFLTIPAVEVLPTATIDVPITLDITDASLYGADLTFTYDPGHVSVSNVRVGAKATGWSIATNLNEPGVIKIAMAGATPITTNGELINFSVTALGDPGTQSSITLTQGVLNEEAIPSTLNSGSVRISVPVVANFAGTPTTGIAPSIVTFTNGSTGDYDTCAWTFGDGGTSTDCNPTHSYTTPGVYTVGLTVSGLGGKDTISRASYITNYDPVRAGFTGTPTNGIAPLLVSFTNVSSGDYDTCAWTFGDGGTSSSCANPIHSYTVAGVYTVDLTASGPGGSDTFTRTGYITVNSIYNVTGSISYWNGGSPVPGTQLTLTGDKVYIAISGTEGTYTIQGASVDSYVLSPSKSDGDNGISAYDASFALQHGVGLITLTGNAALAADVNSSGAITSMDASYVLQKAVGLIPLPFPGSGQIWKFDPVDRSITILTGNLTGQNFTAVLLGDISGNWTNPAGMGKTESKDPLQSGAASLTIPAVDVLPSATIEMPINLDITDASLYGADLTFTYDPSLVSISNIKLGVIATGWSIAANLSEPGVVRIATAGASPITTDGDILTFSATAIGNPGSQSALSLTNGDLNERGIPSTLKSGLLRISTPVVADFTGTPTSGPAPLSVAFTNNSTGDYDTCSWTFGDGGTSTNCNPTHNYAMAGVYSVELTVSGSGGSNKLIKPDYINTYTIPGLFNKTSPANLAPNRPKTLTLTWETSNGAEEYEYCLKKSGGTCTWISTGINTKKTLTGLTSATYKWQVRAKNVSGTTSANNGIWWSFTVPPIPGAFNKTSPLNNTIKRPTTLTLSWTKSTNATKYEYCIKRSLSAACTWKPTGTTLYVKLTGLIRNTKYFWQVRAKNAVGATIANSGTWWNFTTTPQ